MCELCKIFFYLCDTFVFEEAHLCRTSASIVSDYNSSLSETDQANIKPDLFRDTASFKISL